MEYIFYLLPRIDAHESNKICYSNDILPSTTPLETLQLPWKLFEFQGVAGSSRESLFNDPETLFQEKKLCQKCAFHLYFWYDSLILEKRFFTYPGQSTLSKYAFSQYKVESIYPNINHPSLQYIDPIKVNESLQQLSKKRAYTHKDIQAYDISMEIFQWISKMYQTYHILIFYEEYQ